MLKTTDLKGVVGAAITPLTESFEIDVSQLKAHCDSLITDGCAFTSVFGTTGEGPSFSVRQKLAALQQLSDLGMDMSRQIAGVMTSSVDDAAAMYSDLARLKCRAALIIPPYFYRDAGIDGVASYYETLVEKAGIPIWKSFCIIFHTSVASLLPLNRCRPFLIALESALLV
jgi:4-hydroxy-tetrahydrodipicolinate synthase